MQRCHGHEGLVGRAGRVGAAQRAVQQWLVERLVERLPALGIDAVYKQIGVKRGLADKRQHVAGARVERHQRAAPVAEHVFNQLLQANVERQHDGVAGRRGAGREVAHGPAAGRGLDLLDAGVAVQLLLKALLNAQLADVVGAPVVALVVAGLNDFFFCLVDAADVANHMAAQLAVRIAAEKPRLDVNAGKTKALGRKTCHFLVGQSRANRQ